MNSVLNVRPFSSRLPLQQRRSHRASAKMASAMTSISYTQYECNTFKIGFKDSGATVLVDPWLVDELTFYGQEWLFRGTKRAQIDFAEAAKCDLVLLTQSLDDHLHQPTLRRMDKATPIVCPPSAVGILRTLGFRNLTVVDHNQSAPVLGKLVITGTVGALVGPPWSKRENGYVIQEPSSGLRLYYEPHADYDAKSVAAVGAVDVVISCVKTQGLGKQGVGSYPLVMGADNTIPLVKQLRPSVLIPLFNAEFETSGPLTTIMTTRGSLEEAAEGLRRAGVPAVIALPDATAGVPREIEVPVRGSVKEVQVLT